MAANNVTLPDEAQSHLADAISSFRLAALSIEPWMAEQSAPVRMTVSRLMQWWLRAVALAEPLLVQSASVVVVDDSQG